MRPAVSSDDIVKRLRTVQTFTADNCEELSLITDQAAAEIERLRAAIDAVLLAATDKGSHPEYHDELRRRHEREWPTLWRAIAAMQEARR